MRILTCVMVSFSSPVFASGLDVQLKDLRGSYYYVLGGAKECAKLNASESKKFGRLTHCEPTEAHVLCKIKDGGKLFAFEQKEACETSAKQGVDPTLLDEE